ncbi:MAG TPA: serine hydrolase [Microscillaceae bacterium]|nr:serine hydrolase [Microscillaceae bacterium]
MKILKKIFKYLGILILLLVVAFFVFTAFPKYNYLRKAIYYNLADIDDYKIFDNRTIKAGKHQPWTTTKDYNKKAPSSTSLQKIEGYETVSFLVLQNSSIKYEKYWNSYSDSSWSNSFSMAKSVISLLIGAAIDEGKIKSVDQKVGDFLPQFKEGLNNQLTIRHLLSMSSGLNWDEDYAGPTSMTTIAYYGKNLERSVKEMKVVTTPGKKNIYQSGNTQVLAFVLEKATGKTVADYASEKLWKPLGAKHDALWSLDKENGHEKAYCCFNSNARDFARLGQLILLNGKWQGRQVISEKYVKEATTPDKSLIAEDSNEANNYYGYQFWILKYKGNTIPYMRGILGQYIFIIPEKNAVVVRLGHKRDPQYGDYQAPKDVYAYLDAAFEILD